MWNLQILGVDLYHVLSCFWVYSFFGWIWETAYVSVKVKHFVNRGFVEGPVLTLYGTGAMTVYLILRPFDGNWVMVYFGGMAAATVLEYVTGVLMETLFHTRWWDYSNKKWNFQGRICLGSSILWGFFSLMLFLVFQPIVNAIVDFPPKPVGELLTAGVTVLYAVDCGISVAAAVQLGEKLQMLEQFRESFSAYMQNTRVRRLITSLRARMSVPLRESPERMRLYLAERRQAFSDLLDQQLLSEWSARSEDLKRDLMSQFDRFIGSYSQKKQFQDHATGRYLRAYPHLRNSFLQKLADGEEYPAQEESADSDHPSA